MRHWPQASVCTYPVRGTWNSTGAPRSSARDAAWNATDGMRARFARGSRSSSTSESPAAWMYGARVRSTARGATSSCIHPDSTSSCVSAVRAYPPTSREQPSSALRVVSTSRACEYGARGSTRLPSPSNITAARRRLRTGANAAERVPTTILPWPCRTER